MVQLLSFNGNCTNLKNCVIANEKNKKRTSQVTVIIVIRTGYFAVKKAMRTFSVINKNNLSSK